MSGLSEQRPLELIHPPPTAEQRQMLPSQILGTGVFILTEAMFFAGLISAFTVSRAGAVGGIWPPPGQPMLPVAQTALNTVALILSAVALWYSGKVFKEDPVRAKRPFQISVALGALFVCMQGFEWFNLLAAGLTLQSSTYGAFFYLIVGAHALHAIFGIAVLAYVYRLLHQGLLSRPTMAAMQLFWYFVVGLWPVIYIVVYLT